MIILALGIMLLDYVTRVGINTQPSSSTPVPISGKPTATVTDEWKTYTNEKYGFIFDYPRSLIYKEVAKKNPEGIFIALGPDSYSPEDIYYKPLVRVVVDEVSLSVDDFINSSFCNFGNCASAKDALDLTIDGVAAKRVVNPPSPVTGWSEEIVVFRQGGNLFNIGVAYHESVYGDKYRIEKKKEIFEKIISAFKFLD